MTAVSGWSIKLSIHYESFKLREAIAIQNLKKTTTLYGLTNAEQPMTTFLQSQAMRHLSPLNLTMQKS